MLHKYYHSAISTEQPLDIMYPEGYYEKVSERTGCPEHLFGDPLASFRKSDIGEVAFAKSPEAAIIAGANTQCLSKDELCVLDIYETEAEPDLDLSDCPNDFSLIEEVRYRKPVLVERKITIQLEPNLLKQIKEEGYGQKEVSKEEMIILLELTSGEYGGTDIDEDFLECIKDHIRDCLHTGKTQIPSITEEKLNEYSAQHRGIPFEQYIKEKYEEEAYLKPFWEEYERKLEQIKKRIKESEKRK